MAASDDLSKLASRAKKEEDRVAAARQKAKAEYGALDARPRQDGGGRAVEGGEGARHESREDRRCSGGQCAAAPRRAADATQRANARVARERWPSSGGPRADRHPRQRTAGRPARPPSRLTKRSTPLDVLGAESRRDDRLRARPGARQRDARARGGHRPHAGRGRAVRPGLRHSQQADRRRLRQPRSGGRRVGRRALGDSRRRALLASRRRLARAPRDRRTRSDPAPGRRRRRRDLRRRRRRARGPRAGRIAGRRRSGGRQGPHGRAARHQPPRRRATAAHRRRGRRHRLGHVQGEAAERGDADGAGALASPAAR